jgi:hypothetical protein
MLFREGDEKDDVLGRNRVEAKKRSCGKDEKKRKERLERKVCEEEEGWGLWKGCEGKERMGEEVRMVREERV